MTTQKKPDDSTLAADFAQGIPGVEAMTQLLKPATLEQPMAVASEMLRFTAQRFEAHATLWQKASQCKGLSEVLALQARFAQDMAADYGKEATLLMRKVGDGLQNRAK